MDNCYKCRNWSESYGRCMVALCNWPEDADLSETSESEKKPLSRKENYMKFFGMSEELADKVLRAYERRISMDNVNHPEHYTKGGVECIEAIKASMSREAFCGYCKGNILKYIWRYEDKGQGDDLKKARVYLNWLIDAVGDDDF